MGSIKQGPFFIFGYVPLMKSTGQKITIKSWAEEDRPREKLAIKGKSFLSDVELIAILIGSGNKKESAVELSKRILFTYNNIRGKTKSVKKRVTKNELKGLYGHFLSKIYFRLKYQYLSSRYHLYTMIRFYDV